FQPSSLPAFQPSNLPTFQPLGLYLHIPWCATRCIYCDFNTYIDGTADLKARYQAALRREIREAGAVLERPALSTIFFGGGTPTALAPEQLIELVDTVRASFALEPEAEITTEANPGTLTIEYLRALRQGGINRLSLGVQSFDDRELAFLSRLHNAEVARQAVKQARRAGFDNVSLDLIFNLPDQTVAQWQYSLTEALRLEPEHLSIYSLIVEAGTPLHRQVSQGQIPAPDDDLAAEMYAVTLETLATAGYAQYEISNWARAGAEADWETPRLASAHNLIYWRNQPYLGLGAGAYGTLNGQRWANVKRPQAYIANVEAGAGLGPARDEQTVETIPPATAMVEEMMLGLRLVREGVGAAEFEARFGLALSRHYAQAIDFGLKHELLEWIEAPAGPRLRLTRSGRFLANQVTLQFME
ncbi:MAG TPA: radical SAM family heme chaperone HemW, partial [Anaerolineae bacterium]|nr:radical SAM family heme chaperone HemW [Anaerolineae bacterium]